MGLCVASLVFSPFSPFLMHQEHAARGVHPTPTPTLGSQAAVSLTLALTLGSQAGCGRCC